MTGASVGVVAASPLGDERVGELFLDDVIGVEGGDLIGRLSALDGGEVVSGGLQIVAMMRTS
jgi:hypothetical protein